MNEPIKRFNLKLKPDQYQKLTELKEHYEVTSITEVLRRLIKSAHRQIKK